MLPASFVYVAPTSVPAAVEALKTSQDARFDAGSVQLLIDLKMRRIHLETLVDLRKIPELYGIAVEGDGLRIGAMTSFRQIMDDEAVRTNYAALAEAVEKSGDPQLLNMEGIGGALAYAAPSTDVAAAVLALYATIEATGPQGARAIPAAAFFTGDRTTALAQDEIITALILPQPFSVSAYEKFRHPAHLGAVCGVAVALDRDDQGTVKQALIGVTGATAHAFRLTRVEEALQGNTLNADIIAKAVNLDTEAREYVSDLQFSGEYRGQLVKILTRRALARLV